MPRYCCSGCRSNVLRRASHDNSKTSMKYARMYVCMYVNVDANARDGVRADAQLGVGEELSHGGAFALPVRPACSQRGKRDRQPAITARLKYGCVSGVRTRVTVAPVLCVLKHQACIRQVLVFQGLKFLEWILRLPAAGTIDARHGCCVAFLCRCCCPCSYKVLT